MKYHKVSANLYIFRKNDNISVVDPIAVIHVVVRLVERNEIWVG